MIPSLQHIKANVHLTDIKKMSFLCDAETGNIFFILFEEENYHQLFFDVSVIFLQTIVLDEGELLEDYLDDIDQKEIISLSVKNLQLIYEHDKLIIKNDILYITADIVKDNITCLSISLNVMSSCPQP